MKRRDESSEAAATPAAADMPEAVESPDAAVSSGGRLRPVKTVGSRAEVYHGTAKKTSGGLTRTSLTKNKEGRIVSKRAQEHGKRIYRSVLSKMGYKPEKGSFKLFSRKRSSKRSSRSHSSRKR